MHPASFRSSLPARHCQFSTRETNERRGRRASFVKIHHAGCPRRQLPSSVRPNACAQVTFSFAPNRGEACVGSVPLDPTTAFTGHGACSFWYLSLSPFSALRLLSACSLLDLSAPASPLSLTTSDSSLTLSPLSPAITAFRFDISAERGQRASETGVEKEIAAKSPEIWKWADLYQSPRLPSLPQGLYAKSILIVHLWSDICTTEWWNLTSILGPAVPKGFQLF